jgi:hypothetical protein
MAAVVAKRLSYPPDSNSWRYRKFQIMTPLRLCRSRCPQIRCRALRNRAEAATFYLQTDCKEETMSDFRDPYGLDNRPRNDPYGYEGASPGWGWLAGIVVVALIVAFFAFSSDGWRTAELTLPPPTAAQHAQPPGSTTIVPPAQQPMPTRP